MLALFHWFGWNMPKNESFKIIKQSGFDGIMLWWNDEFGDMDFPNNPEIARNAGLEIENIHAPFQGINDIWLNNIDGNRLTQYYLDLIDECAQYGIPTMVLHPTSGSNPPLYNQIGLDRFKRIVDRAERKNVNVAFENMRKHEYLMFLLEHIDSARAGFCFDSGHHLCWSQNCDLLAQYGSRLMALHLHDNNGIDDQHLLPFDGTIDWNHTMYQITKLNYKGMIALEVENHGYENLSPEVFLQLAFERSKKLEGIANCFHP